jgi:hypothetical protein
MAIRIVDQGPGLRLLFRFEAVTVDLLNEPKPEASLTE